MMTQADWTILMRASLAAVLGYLIAIQRRTAGAPIRGRAISLAALTAATLTALFVEIQPDELGRIVQGITTGIGFLGAGVIFRNAIGEVHGLTTAAGMWSMSAVGATVGSGHELLGILLTVVIYLLMSSGEWPIMKRLQQRQAAQADNTTCVTDSLDGDAAAP